MSEETTPKRTRRKTPRRKRTRFQIPARPPLPVRALWEQASEEEQRKAHVTATAILEYWLGRVRKEEVAEQLGVPPLRVWQLSQQAVSGMLAGLLRQPRSRGERGSSPTIPPQDDPRRLRQRIGELEAKLKGTEELVRVLKELPWNREVVASAKPKEYSLISAMSA